MILEVSIERRFMDLLKGFPDVCALKFSPVGNTGWPDRIVLLPNSRCCFVEFKRPGGEPRKLQVVRIKELRRLGHDVEVHTDAYEAARFVGECYRRAVGSPRLSKKGGEVARVPSRCSPFLGSRIGEDSDCVEGIRCSAESKEGT